MALARPETRANSRAMARASNSVGPWPWCRVHNFKEGLSMCTV